MVFTMWMSGGSSRMRTTRWILGSGAEIGCSEERDHRRGFKHEKDYRSVAQELQYTSMSM
jgi:hypothetical protein